LITALARIGNRPVAVVWSDFRVEGAAFGHANSRRFTAFLHHLALRADRVPLIYVVNSAGVSLMEGRTAFADAFAIWPALRSYAADHPVFTCATGRCLGLAPLLFGLDTTGSPWRAGPRST
jgi:acetyl-CoA carboxylase carboxyltransferase component